MSYHHHPPSTMSRSHLPYCVRYVTTGLWMVSGASSLVSSSSSTAGAAASRTSMMAMMSSSPSATIAKQRRAAIAQLCSTSDKWKNLLQIAQCAGLAKQNGASMLFLPECFGFMGESSEQTLQQAEPAIDFAMAIVTAAETPLDHHHHHDGDKHFESLRTTLRQLILQYSESNQELQQPLSEATSTSEQDNPIDGFSMLDGLKVIAQESGLWISGGGMHVADAPPHPISQKPRVYNTHIILDDQGRLKCLYRKIHLFDVSIPGKVELRESATTAAGTELVVCDSPIGRLGLSTCYDMRFGEMYVPLVQEGGAQILLMPSAFTVPTGSAHWHTLLRARAIEHQCYVLAAAQFGRHNVKRESYGHSLAIDPWGQIVADAGGYDGTDTAVVAADGTAPTLNPTPSVIFCDIDLENLESVRQRMPIQQHRVSSSFSFLEN